MAFPFQQPPTNFPPSQMSMFPGPVSRAPGNMMLPGQGIPPGAVAAPKGNFMQNILGRFLPSGGGAGVQQAASIPTQAAATGGGLTNTLNNVQQVLKVVQQTAPVVQQYGPMVKNIPAMFRMMKAFNDSESDDEDNAAKKDNVDEESNTTEETTDKSTVKTNDVNKHSASDQTPEKQKESVKKEKKAETITGQSKPLLYI
ncbi:VrrA/YqfQ family protein [Lentibacillus sp. N15]|uniref:VrrA/YqfQ family protein n=1 Tax=Lentibacillus songyuanensis TaxID=3136161 RepID=UPI0031BA5244